MSVDDDKSSIREIVREVYAALSGPPGPRAYEPIKRLYHPAARLVRTGIGPDGKSFADIMTVDEHNADVDRKLADIAFLEEEIAHECEVFGHVAQVRSVYRSVYGEGASAREGRGINFMNLVKLDGEWKFLSVVWDNEREGLAIDG